MTLATTLPLLALAIGLAMDSTAVAAARGVAARHVRIRDALLVGALFGTAQGALPLAGYWLGARLGPYVDAVDHWIAFTLLAVIGAKMIYEARKPAVQRQTSERPFAVVPLLVLSLATSIDAFAAGLTLPLLGVPPLVSAATIAVVTATLSCAGALVGRRAGATFGGRLETAGGMILIGIGTKILLVHTL